MNCTITEGSPEPTIRWLKNKTSLDKADKTLFLRDVTYEDEGKYTCEAENKGGVANDSIDVFVDSKSLPVYLKMSSVKNSYF